MYQLPSQVPQDITLAALLSKNAQKRAEAFTSLFDHSKEKLEGIKVVRAEKGGLTYVGILQKCLTIAMFDYFKAGNFAFDNSNAQVKGSKLLVIGRDTIPTLEEFENMDIPVDKLDEVEGRGDATGFKQKRRNAFSVHSLTLTKN
jgi:hypothetical protein